MNEQELLQALITLLNSKGYPKDALVVEPSMTGRASSWLAPDLLVVDPKTNEHLAAFELKASVSAFTKAAVAALLEHYANTIGLQPDHLYLATFGPVCDVQIYRVIGHSEYEPLPIVDFPSFDALAAHRFATSKDRVSVKRHQTTDAFSRTCRLIGIAGLILLGADAVLEIAFGWQFLTPARLAVAGVVAGLLVLPYAAKFKALGIEWERYHSERGHRDI